MPTVQEPETELQTSPGQLIPLYKNGLRAFTFWVSDTLYAIDISKVLTISQEMEDIQSLPAQAKGLVGMIEFQDNAIPVLDFANMLGFNSGVEKNTDLINLLNEKEKDHIDWVSSLEDSLLNDTPFIKTKDPHKCAFGQWSDNYKSRDETFMEILSEFKKPHKQIHSMADKLLTMKKNGELDHALKMLRLERGITLKRLLKRFDQARTHLKESSRQVLLYVTEDGTTPIVALRIDDINDVIDFKPEQFKPMDRINNILNETASDLVIAYLKQEGHTDCLLIESSNLANVAQI
ncbi:MAG: chemotaxis protein CheW [gamma proteobacterium symbiont of Taylorina sp.]|nr:chemotaxis protein CheW [gamma proteobacterium symbiont of Taylorina sp.]